jgi:hypothetical protein
VEFALALRPRDRSRPLLLVFTDGKDNVSWLSDEAVLESAAAPASSSMRYDSMTIAFSIG